MSSTTWLWDVKDFVLSTPKRDVESAAFFHDGHKIHLSAKKWRTDTSDELGLYVNLLDCAMLPATIGIGLATKITLVHRRDRKLGISMSSNENAPSFYSSASKCWGSRNFIGIDEVSKPDSGFLSGDGSILVEVQLSPITSVSWKLPNSTNWTAGGRRSPEFTIEGTWWQVELNPKVRCDGTATHVRASLHNVVAKGWGDRSMQAKWSIARLDKNMGHRRHKHASSDIFSATSDIFGINQCACSLLDGAPYVIANVTIESVRWSIKAATLSSQQRIEGPTFSLGGTNWKAIAGNTIVGEAGNKMVVALAPWDLRTCNGDFGIRPEFQISLSNNNTVLVANADADERFVENGSVFWGACVFPPTAAVATLANCEATFTLVKKPSSVCWVINDFRSFLGSALWPPIIKSGKIIADDSEVEVTVYPRGNGSGRLSHVSCFIAATPTVASDVSRKMEFSFTAHHSREKTHSVSIEEVVLDGKPVGVARFLRLEYAGNFLGEDGALRVDVSWRRAFSAAQTPIPPCYEESDVNLLQPMLAVEKKWRDARASRGVSCLSGELYRAVQMISSELSEKYAWEMPIGVVEATEDSADTWAALILKQNKVRKLVAQGGDISDACFQRDEARRAFCKAVDDMNAFDGMCTLRALRAREIPNILDLEARYPLKASAGFGDTAIGRGSKALDGWANSNEVMEQRLKKTEKATDKAARVMRHALGCLFNDNSTTLFDEKKCQSSYCSFFVKLHVEERLRTKCAANFPTESVVEAYYALKEKAAMAKKRVQELWEEKERALARKGEVAKWLTTMPNTETIRKREREGKQLVAKRRQLEADQLYAELEEDGPDKVAKEKAIGAEMRAVTDALRKVDKARLKDLSDLWAIQQDHFPELTLISEPSLSEITPFLSEHRSLDMYLECKRLHTGRHQIWQASFLGEPCILKQFSNDVEMLREAKVQHRLRHRAVVPIQALFRETGASYIQLPLYKSDLAAWLRANTVDADTARNMVSCILHVVAHIHQCHIVHGDLKPQNFLVDDDSRLVLCDFGSSRTTIDATATLATVTRVCGGTHGYIAPELAQDGSKPSKPSDLYSVGCIIHKDLLPHCSTASGDLKDLWQLAETFCSQDPKLRPTAMAALAETTQRPLSDFPAYWKTKGGVLCRLYDNTSYMEAQALRLLRDSTTHTGDGACSLKRLKEAVVTKVERNENPVLFRNYMRKKAEIAEYHRKSHTTMARIDLPLGEDKEWLIDPTVNECYLLHGTPVANVPKILEDGLNERVANFGGIYGVGSYFASESCKAMQYCQRPLLLHDPVEPGKEYCMLMCRVLVGDAYSTDKVFQPSPGFQGYLREPPARQDKKRWDSIIAAPGKKTTRDGTQAHAQTHYETIIFDRAQIYPEFAIYFKVP